MTGEMKLVRLYKWFLTEKTRLIVSFAQIIRLIFFIVSQIYTIKYSNILQIQQTLKGTLKNTIRSLFINDL